MTMPIELNTELLRRLPQIPMAWPAQRRLLGFPTDYRLPADLPLAYAWRLVGNSLSVDVVRQVLAAVS